MVKDLALQLKRDRLTLGMIVGLPLIQLFLFGFVINSDPKHMPTAIIDADQTEITRTVVATMKGSGYFDIVGTLPDEEAGRAALARGKVLFVLNIPAGFTRSVLQGERPSLLVEADATDPTATGMALASVGQIPHSAAIKDLTGPLARLAGGDPAFGVQVHALYNPEGITTYNIIPGLMGMVLTMTMVLMTGLAITRARFQVGAVSSLDVENQSLLLDQTRAMLPPVAKQLARIDYQLEVYGGRGPGEGRNPPLDLATLHLPETLPRSLPSALARQRPDILAAEALLHQASAEVGVATANLYPQITLSGSLGSERTSAQDLLSGINIWSLGGNLMQPLFRGGELRARKRQALAAYAEASGGYRQTVLQGLLEVADALSALDADARALAARAAADHARTGARIAEQQYRLGGISELALLDVQRQLLQAELDRVKAQADRYADTATLLQALGGGWWRD